jgi:hypothetical protein
MTNQHVLWFRPHLFLLLLLLLPCHCCMLLPLYVLWLRSVDVLEEQQGHSGQHSDECDEATDGLRAQIHFYFGFRI